MLNTLRRLNYIMGAQLLSFAAPVVAIPFLINNLGAEQYSIAALAHALIVIMNMTIQYGFNTTIPIEINRAHSRHIFINQIASQVLTLQLSNLAIYIVILSIAFTVYPFLDIWSALLPMTLCSIGQALFVHSVFIGTNHLGFIALWMVFSRVIPLVPIILFINSPDDTWIYGLSYGVPSVVFGFVSLAFFSQIFGKPTFQFTKIIYRYKSNFVPFTASCMSSIFVQIPILATGALLSPQVAGLYVASYKVVLAAKTLFSTCIQSMLGWFTAPSKSDTNDFFIKLFAASLSTGFVFTITSHLYADTVFSFVFLNSNELISENISTLSIALPFAFINTAILLVTFPLKNLHSYRLGALSIACMVSTLLFITLAHQFGSRGANFAFIFSEVLLSIILSAYVFGRKAIK